MNKNEERFLIELDKLFRYYSIDTVMIRGSVANNDPLRIAFFSNDRELSFMAYRQGAFLTIYSETPRFEPPAPEPYLERECRKCKHLKEVTPRGKKVEDCGWCTKTERSVSYNALTVCTYYEEEQDES